MRLTIHQPEHMPWLGLFHKIAQVDKFVILDDVQFRKNYYQNRNKIRTRNGWSWFTVPVRHSLETPICKVEISEDTHWKDKWCDSIYHAYKKAACFDSYFGELSKLIKQDIGYLSELNILLLKLLCGFLGVKTEFIRQSELNIHGNGSSLILEICKKTSAEVYLSGISGKDYLDIGEFDKSGIKVLFQDFHHPIYMQLYEPFIPCMSVVDLLFNYGPKSLDMIRGISVPVMAEVFL